MISHEDCQPTTTPTPEQLMQAWRLLSDLATSYERRYTNALEAFDELQFLGVRAHDLCVYLGIAYADADADADAALKKELKYRAEWLHRVSEANGEICQDDYEFATMTGAYADHRESFGKQKAD